MTLKHALGRLPRKFDPTIPHLSALRMMQKQQDIQLPPVPDAVDYAAHLPQDLGMMGNDRLGDCTSAGCYHLEQVWTQCSKGSAETAKDSDVVKWYSEVSGYNPRTGANDNGANEQDVLKLWMMKGLPFAGKRRKLMGFVEIDPRNLDDVRRVIFECGAVYIGFEVPGDLPEDPGATWDDCHAEIEGGHCVILPGFDKMKKNFCVISWGSRYTMTERFWARYVDECYALVDADWADANGKTLLGIDLKTLAQQMDTLRKALRFR